MLKCSGDAFIKEVDLKVHLYPFWKVDSELQKINFLPLLEA